MDSAQKRDFLRREFHDLTLRAVVQRSKIYSPHVTAHGRTSLHRGLSHALDTLAREYAHPVSEEQHLRHIGELADRISADCPGALRGNRFRLGPAQKALNLFLKYLWCAGWIPTPPHCPFDSIIIGTLPHASRCAWTDLDSMAQYQQLVAAARRIAGDRTLAQWELEVYETLASRTRVT